MSTRALDAFEATHERAKTLLHLHSSGPGRPKKEREDILRAAVSLVVAGVDSYFHDKIPERVTPFLMTRKGRRIPGAMIKLLERHGGVEKLLDIMYRKRPHSHIRTAVRRAHADLTFQKPEKIEQALRLLGVSDFWFKVARQMGRRTSKESVKRKLGQYVARRDRIVHEADRGPGDHLNSITKEYVAGCLSFVARFIQATDVVINSSTGQ